MTNSTFEFAPPAPPLRLMEGGPPGDLPDYIEPSEIAPASTCLRGMRSARRFLELVEQNPGSPFAPLADVVADAAEACEVVVREFGVTPVPPVTEIHSPKRARKLLIEQRSFPSRTGASAWALEPLDGPLPPPAASY